MTLLRRTLFAILLVLPVAPAIAEDRATILVFDASGSMWAQLPEGRSRIEVARDVLGDFLRTRDQGRPLGVVAYGHNRKGDCSDIEVIAPVGRQDGANLSHRLNTLMPKGKTPLAASLRQAALLVPRTSEEADIVLVTDGLETCDLDPCAVAAELAREGIPIRAHVVGFGLSEGEVRQIACIAETTGGLVLAPQTGAELADALVRVSDPVSREADAPGRAALDLTLKTDLAGWPETVLFRAVNQQTNETLELGTLAYATSQILPVDLAEGIWLITADAGDMGNGALEVQVTAGDNRTIYVPFTGPMPSLVMDPRGPYRAGSAAAFPYEVTREGLAVGGADFVLSLLPAGMTDLNQAVTWSMQEGIRGARVGQLNLPPEPGRYTLAFHRYGEVDLAKAIVALDIEAETRPRVHLDAPPTVAPGGPLPAIFSGGMNPADRLEVWKNGVLHSWDQSRYVSDLFENAYGPAKPLMAPAELGSYEIVYVFADLDGPDAVAARLPFEVSATAGQIDEGAVGGQSAAPIQAATRPGPEAGTQVAAGAAPISGDSDPGHGPDAALAPEHVGFRCEGPFPCPLGDPATGLYFMLPAGWYTDKPAAGATLAGARDGKPTITFYSPMEVPDTYVLNPSQWLDSNGPCSDVKAGRLCRFTSGATAPQADIDMLQQTVMIVPGLAASNASSAGQQPTTGDGRAPDLAKAVKDQAALLAASDPEAAKAMAAIGDIMAQAGARGGEVSAGDVLSALTGGAGIPGMGAALTGMGAQALAPQTPCEKETACPFAVPMPKVSGIVPVGWRYSQPSLTTKGKVTIWFSAFDPAGNLKKLGLNQDGGDNCTATAAGPLCEHSPYISTDETMLIATSLSR